MLYFICRKIYKYYLFNLKKNHENEKDRTYTSMKKEFYQKQIDKLEDNETNENLKQSIIKDFSLYPYKKNYLFSLTKKVMYHSCQL